jgi:SNF2 Helicase protein
VSRGGRELPLAEGDCRIWRDFSSATLDAEGGDALLSDVEALEQAGVVVRMPASWPGGRPSRPAVEATVGSNAPSRVDAAQLLDFSVEASLEGAPLTREEIAQLLAATDGLAMLRGQWVEVDPARLQATLDRYAEIEQIARKQGVSFCQAMRLMAGADVGAGEARQVAEASWAHVTAGPVARRDTRRLPQPWDAHKRPSGRDIKDDIASLSGRRPALAWLSITTRPRCLSRRRHGARQAIQVLAPLLTVSERGGERRPSLIVAPASLIANWAGEAERFARR